MLWDPVRYDETCPSSDGACAVVIGDEAGGAGPPTARRPGSRARRCAPSRRCSPAATRSTRGRAGLRGGAVAQAGITTPAQQIDVAEMYVPFSWFEPMWLENLGFPRPATAGS